MAPAVDDGFVGALECGAIIAVAGVVKFESQDVVLADRRRLRPDVVICATGYQAGLEGMVGHLDVLDEHGVPCFQGAEANPELPGLWFLGVRPRLFGNFHAARCDSCALSRTIARDERSFTPIVDSELRQTTALVRTAVHATTRTGT